MLGIALVAMTVAALLFVGRLASKAPLVVASNPIHSPNPTKAPWYFLGLQDLFVRADPWYAGVMLPALVIIGAILILSAVLLFLVVYFMRSRSRVRVSGSIQT